MVRYTVFLLMVCAGSAISEEPIGNFALDPAKPYVYIAYDHHGPREPALEGEVARGLWLELVNNCRLPIRVRIFDLGSGDPAVGLFHDVVSYGGSSFQILPDTSSRNKPKKDAPKGYTFDVASVTDLPPGDRLLFSVPMNHIDYDWYMRVPFELVVNEKLQALEPYSFVNFTCNQLPENLRGRFDCNMPKKIGEKK